MAAISNEGFISVMLMGITIMLTIMAIMIGVAAFYGYTALEEKALERANIAASNCATKTAEEIIKGDGIKPLILTCVEEILRRKDQEREIGESLSEAYAEETKPSVSPQSVSSDYPGEEGSK